MADAVEKGGGEGGNSLHADRRRCATAITCAHGDIVLLRQSDLISISEDCPDLPLLQAVLVANHFKPVMLINAAFQFELAHHLDTSQEWQGC